MKIILLLSLAGAGLAPLLVAEPADGIRIDTKICTITTAGRPLSFQPGAPAETNSWLGALAPATLHIGDETVEFGADGSIRPNSVGGVPKLQVISTPSMITRPGISAGLSIREPAEYFEKNADGSFQLHRIPEDSPDDPHCDLTVTARPKTVAGTVGYELDCVVDVAFVQGREKIPNVSLDVGKPQLATFHTRTLLALAAEKWYCLVLPNPSGTYAPAFLIKASSAKGIRIEAAPAQTKAAPGNSPASP